MRHFDAPEAVDTRFYEVRAKSILNRVPEASRMPFRWTINPYRGCAHACAYCLWGETPILLADGRLRKLAEIEAGDWVCGTEYHGQYRRYVATEVRDKWLSVKPAYRVELADGTELISSGDHRFLTERGWKFVADGALGRQRPHLTTNNHLVGTGHFANVPDESEQYRRGYLCGMVRGDGHLKYYRYERPNGTAMRSGGFRLALADTEALSRACSYLVTEGVMTRLRVFAPPTQAHREMLCVGTTRQEHVSHIHDVIEWPIAPSVEWLRGFLAGIFDVEGARHEAALRITNGDTEILRWIEIAFRRLGFSAVLEPPQANGVRSVRLRGGLKEHLRFFHLTDPAITRKRSLTEQMVKTFADLRVVSVEPLGRSLPLYDISTGTGDFIANGVVSHNCFARPTHEYLDFDAGRDFEREIVVKVNAPERLRVELARPRWEREHVALGTNTDPYQWAEGRYRLMPGIWQALLDARNPCSVLTKSPLLLRDIELMRELSRVTEFSAALSIPTLDRRTWRETEPRSPNPRARLEAVRRLVAAGIRTSVLVAPLMPGINDAPDQVAEVVRLAREAGADVVTGIGLHLRGSTRDVFMDWLRGARPELVARYESLYRGRAYLPPAERARLAGLLERFEPPSGEWLGSGQRGGTADAAVSADPYPALNQPRLF